ncbi:MAG: hypothetical protein U1F56_20705 [Rubrivivax sp.]
MGTAAAALLLAATVIVVLGCVGAWLMLRRPARRLERRRREEALAAAAKTTPAVRVSPYGTPPPSAPAPAPAPAPDPCAPGLSDNERVEAMRRLLLQGPAAPARTVAEQLAQDPGPMSTTPMAWNPTLPPDEAEVIDLRRPGSRPRVREGDHEHVMLD